MCALLGQTTASDTKPKPAPPELKTNKGPSDTEKFDLNKENLYRWPDNAEMYRMRDSKMKTVTLRYGKTKTSNVVTKFQYWTREKFNKKTNATYFELHGKCIFENVDVTSYSNKDGLECNVGLQRDGARDWALIKMPFKAGSVSVDDQVKDWSCTDSVQSANYYGEAPNDIETDTGGYQNCYIYRNGSNVNASNPQSAPSSGRLLADEPSSTTTPPPSSGDSNTVSAQIGVQIIAYL